ncbi:hypothetical protein VN97_g7064 [Penicillium thymicola]|uniref:Uncharacterized protein n=1 Tax=Penicillium thymicola TaxID=293382 RepID=A0AAI9X7E4_PENTH|nr:hypothetical protein VN97_g7064 [Penicillium thymicola]
MMATCVLNNGLKAGSWCIPSEVDTTNSPSYSSTSTPSTSTPLNFEEVLLPRIGDIHPHPGIYKVDAPLTPPDSTAMAPHFFNKLFKRKKKGPEEPRFTLRECSPNAIGIWDSTCEINGDIFQSMEAADPTRATPSQPWSSTEKLPAAKFTLSSPG